LTGLTGYSGYYRIFRIFFAFPEERQKVSTLFEGTIPRKATTCDFSLALNTNICVAQA
jgi:hypothetical protein